MKFSPSAPTAPSAALLAATSSVILAAALSACSDSDKTTSLAPGFDGGAPLDAGPIDGSPGGNDASLNDGGDASPSGGPKVTASSKDPTMTFAKFQALCDARGGLVQTHAACSGNNTCKGVSFNKYSKVVTEHTCRAINTCAGFSCVDLPKDTGLAAKVVFEQGGCADCHQHKLTDSQFAVFVPAGANGTAALTRFSGLSRTYLINAVAFGVGGIDSLGRAYHNMPAYYEKYSVAEIARVVDHVKTLTPAEAPYDPLEVPGGTGGMGGGNDADAGTGDSSTGDASATDGGLGDAGTGDASTGDGGTP